MSLRGQRAGTRSLVSMDRYLIATVGAMSITVSAETVEGLLTSEESGSIEAPMVQGRVYAAVDLAARMGVVPEEEGPDTRVILLAQGTARASVRVASVHGLIECEGRRVLPLPRQFRGEERGWGFFMDSVYRVFQRGQEPAAGEKVTGIKLKSIITQPLPGETLAAGTIVMLGAAYAGEAQVTGVDVSLDGGANWRAAQLIGPNEPYAWRQWQYVWADAAPGEYLLMSRAGDDHGRQQPPQAE